MRFDYKRIETDLRPAVDALRSSISTISRKPIVLVPLIVGVIFSEGLSLIVGVEFFSSFGFAPVFFYSTAAIIVGLVVLVIGAVVSFFLIFVSLDMVRDSFFKREPNIRKSIEYVFGRLIVLVIAAIIGQALVFTIFLIPVAISMFIIVFVDEENASRAISKSVEFVRSRPVEIVALAIVAIVARLVLFFIPIVSILTPVTDLVVGLAVLDIYVSYKGISQA